MTFEEVLDQAIAMLQRRGRLTYRTLPFPIGPVPWHAIRSVSIGSRKSVATGASTRIVSVEVIDKYKYIMKRQPRIPQEEEAFGKLTQRPITLLPASLGTTAPELAHAIEIRLAALGSATPPQSPLEGHP